MNDSLVNFYLYCNKNTMKIDMRNYVNPSKTACLRVYYPSHPKKSSFLTSWSNLISPLFYIIHYIIWMAYFIHHSNTWITIFWRLNKIWVRTIYLHGCFFIDIHSTAKKVLRRTRSSCFPWINLKLIRNAINSFYVIYSMNNLHFSVLCWIMVIYLHQYTNIYLIILTRLRTMMIDYWS